MRDIELAALRHRMAMDFGRARGWALTSRPFDVTALSGRRRVDRGRLAKVDWPRAYAEGASRYVAGGRPVGLAAHLHAASSGERRSAAAWARSNGLAASFPDSPSWFMPGRTAVVLFEALSGATAGGG